MATEKNKTSSAKAPLIHVLSAKDINVNAQEKGSTIPAEGFALCVRSLQQGARQGTVGVKTRGEVAFSNKKPWKQKGTGRARAGSRRSPLWRKGGVIFGPQPRVRTLKVGDKTKKQVMQALFWQMMDSQKIVSFKFAHERPKTSLAYKALIDAGLDGKKLLLFVNADDYNTQASFSNLGDVQMVLFDAANAFLLSQGDYWVCLEKDLDTFKEMVKSWI